MTDTNNNADSIAPTPPEGRVFSTLSYILMWWSALTVIQIFAPGQGLLPPIGHLNGFLLYLWLRRLFISRPRPVASAA